MYCYLLIRERDLAVASTGKATMDLMQALASLGAEDSALTIEERSTLDHSGYLDLGVVMSPQELEGYRSHLAELHEVEGEDAGKEVHQEVGTRRLSNLVD